MNKKYLALGILCTLLSIACLAKAFWPEDERDPVRTLVEETGVLDFQQLQAINPDIYGWLTIPGTDISYPLLQRAGDDAFYLTHDSSGAESKAGALFTEESVNGRDFSDPVTVVYGHRMNSGERFGRLEKEFSGRNLEKNREIIVTLPEKALYYEVVGAVRYPGEHLLRKYAFDDPKTFESFFSSLLDGRTTVRSGDRVLILSTCLKWDLSQRYLVLARCVNSNDLTA